MGPNNDDEEESAAAAAAAPTTTTIRIPIPPLRPKWHLWKIWSQKIFRELNFHTQSSSRLYSKMGLARLFYEAVDVTGGFDSLFNRIVNTHYFNFQITSKKGKKGANKDDFQLILVGEIMDCCSGFDLEKVDIIAEDILGAAMDKYVGQGDYVFIWGGKLDKTQRRPLLTLNGFNGPECMVLVYRHDGLMPNTNERGVYEHQFHGRDNLNSFYAYDETVVQHILPKVTQAVALIPTVTAKLTEAQPTSTSRILRANFAKPQVQMLSRSPGPKSRTTRATLPLLPSSVPEKNDNQRKSSNDGSVVECVDLAVSSDEDESETFEAQAESLKSGLSRKTGSDVPDHVKNKPGPRSKTSSDAQDKINIKPGPRSKTGGTSAASAPIPAIAVVPPKQSPEKQKSPVSVAEPEPQPPKTVISVTNISPTASKKDQQQEEEVEEPMEVDETETVEETLPEPILEDNPKTADEEDEETYATAENSPVSPTPTSLPLIISAERIGIPSLTSNNEIIQDVFLNGGQVEQSEDEEVELMNEVIADDDVGQKETTLGKVETPSKVNGTESMTMNEESESQPYSLDIYNDIDTQMDQMFNTDGSPAKRSDVGIGGGIAGPSKPKSQSPIKVPEHKDLNKSISDEDEQEEEPSLSGNEEDEEEEPRLIQFFDCKSFKLFSVTCKVLKIVYNEQKEELYLRVTDGTIPFVDAKKLIKVPTKDLSNAEESPPPMPEVDIMVKNCGKIKDFLGTIEDGDQDLNLTHIRKQTYMDKRGIKHCSFSMDGNISTITKDPKSASTTSQSYSPFPEIEIQESEELINDDDDEGGQEQDIDDEQQEVSSLGICESSFVTPHDNDAHISLLDEQNLDAPVLKGKRKSRIHSDSSDESNKTDPAIPDSSQKKVGKTRSGISESSDDESFVSTKTVDVETERNNSSLPADYVATPALEDHNKSLHAKRKLEFQDKEAEPEPQPSTSRGSTLLSEKDLARKFKCKELVVDIEKNPTIEQIIKSGQRVSIGRKGQLKIIPSKKSNDDDIESEEEMESQRPSRSRSRSVSTTVTQSKSKKHATGKKAKSTITKSVKDDDENEEESESRQPSRSRSRSGSTTVTQSQPEKQATAKKGKSASKKSSKSKSNDDNYEIESEEELESRRQSQSRSRSSSTTGVHPKSKKQATAKKTKSTGKKSSKSKPNDDEEIESEEELESRPQSRSRSRSSSTTVSKSPAVKQAASKKTKSASKKSSKSNLKSKTRTVPTPSPKKLTVPKKSKKKQSTAADEEFDLSDNESVYSVNSHVSLTSNATSVSSVGVKAKPYKRKILQSPNSPPPAKKSLRTRITAATASTSKVKPKDTTKTDKKESTKDDGSVEESDSGQSNRARSQRRAATAQSKKYVVDDDDEDEEEEVVVLDLEKEDEEEEEETVKKPTKKRLKVKRR